MRRRTRPRHRSVRHISAPWHRDDWYQLAPPLEATVREALALVPTFVKHTATGILAAACFLLPAPAALASQPSDALYEKAVRKHVQANVRSNLPNAEEARALMEFDRELFTDEAWEGMVRLQRYAEYLEEIQAKGVEEAPGCEQCGDNRLILEKAWQVVANEFFDAKGCFSQAVWADQLIATLQEAGGAMETKQELYASAERMLSALGDRYSHFLPPSQFRQAIQRPSPAERDYLEAQFVGTGVQLGPISPDGGRLVEAPLAGSPAEVAGIMRGDRVLRIDGIPVEALSEAQAMRMMRGPSGSSITLTVARTGTGPARPAPPIAEVALERRALPQPPTVEAEVQLPDGRYVRYVRLHYFSSAATRAVERAVRRGERDGVDAYIIDLRNNPGGVFEEAVGLSAELLPGGRDVASTVRYEDVVDYTWRSGALPRGVFPSQPLQATSSPIVVIVNSASASASEVLAGALHDNGRAVLVGERTFSKGLVQYYFPMTDGSGVKLTIAKYITPGGHDLTREHGLHPDIACTDYPRASVSADSADSCLQAALRYLAATPPASAPDLR